MSGKRMNRSCFGEGAVEAGEGEIILYCFAVRVFIGV